MRKLLLLTTVLTSIAITSQAQINKGTVLLGGNISGSTGKRTFSNSNIEYDQSSLDLSPSIGFATATNKVWGISFNTGFSVAKVTDQPNQTDLFFSGGNIFHRRYLELGKGFLLFGHAAAGYNYYKNKYQSIDATESRTMRTDNIYFSAYPGITYMVSRKFHLEAGLNNLVYLSYSNQKETNVINGTGSSSESKSFAFSSNFSNSNPFSIGFRFALGK